MATWINHLRISGALLERISAQPQCFTLGNIAPDCGLLQSDGTFDPPAAVTHYAKLGKRDCDFMRFKAEYFDTAESFEQLSFYAGYFCHLMSDVLWCEIINEPAKRLYADEYAADRKEYYRRAKRDWYDIDFLYLQTHPNFAPLETLKACTAKHAAPLAFYQNDNIAVQQRYICDFYDNAPLVERNNFVYLTPAQADEYVNNAAERIYAALQSSDISERLTFALHR